MTTVASSSRGVGRVVAMVRPGGAWTTVRQTAYTYYDGYNSGVWDGFLLGSLFYEPTPVAYPVFVGNDGYITNEPFAAAPPLVMQDNVAGTENFGGTDNSSNDFFGSNSGLDSGGSADFGGNSGGFDFGGGQDSGGSADFGGSNSSSDFGGSSSFSSRRKIKSQRNLCRK